MTVFVYHQDQVLGPYSTSQVNDLLSAGKININAQACIKGTQEWQVLSALPGIVPPPATQVVTPSRSSSAEAPVDDGEGNSEGRTSSLGLVNAFVRWFVNMSPLQGFSMSLFSPLPAFKRRTREEIDIYFNCGDSRSTPNIRDIGGTWPQPWFYWRLLAGGLLTTIAFCFALQYFKNPKLIPGVIVVGAFFMPLACVSFFFEANTPRNISLLQTLRFLVIGGIASLIVALTLFELTPLHKSFLGAMAAGIIEEPAKAVVAIFLLNRCTEYKWILNGLLVGAAVGAGFAGFESAGYILGALLSGAMNQDSLEPFYFTMFLRGVCAPFTHVIWTACIVGALWRAKGDRPLDANIVFSQSFLRPLAFVIALHMLWNSQFLWSLPSNYVGFHLVKYLWIVSLVGSWYLVLLLVQEGLHQVKAAKRKITITPVGTLS